ncbi:unnamed protein product, partial [Aureobasidium mustum]
MTSLAYAQYTVDSAPIEALSEPPSNPSFSPPLSTTSSDNDIPTRGRLDATRPRLGSPQALRASLMAIVDRVEAVKIEHEKLEGGNKFLQSKITSAAPPKKGKSRNAK